MEGGLSHQGLKIGGTRDRGRRPASTAAAESAECLKMTFSEMTADEENGQGLHSGALGGSFRLLAILEEKVCIPLHSPRQSLPVKKKDEEAEAKELSDLCRVTQPGRSAE